MLEPASDHDERVAQNLFFSHICRYDRPVSGWGVSGRSESGTHFSMVPPAGVMLTLIWSSAHLMNPSGPSRYCS